jgi:hypothetical protein
MGGGGGMFMGANGIGESCMKGRGDGSSFGVSGKRGRDAMRAWIHVQYYYAGIDGVFSKNAGGNVKMKKEN